MKLKKINKHGEYVVTMSQVECNLLNELLGYVSYKDISNFPNLDVAMKGMINKHKIMLHYLILIQHLNLLKMKHSKIMAHLKQLKTF